MHLKTAVILAAFASTYALLVFVASEWWQVVPLAFAFALTIVAIGFNIMHDANHEAYSDRRWINRLMGLTLDMVGGSSYFWRFKHNVFHHLYANVAGYDTDVDLAGLGRLTPHHRRLWIHRWQHWYAWLLYGLMVVKWQLYDDFRLVLTRRLGKRHYCPRPRGSQLAAFVAGKLVFFGFAFAIPLSAHALPVVAAVYALTAVVTGIVLGVVFQLAHCVEEADFPLEIEPGRISAPWAVHQVESTVDFARGNRAASWLLGGLNFQIEHHLFARICHVNYPAIAPVVEETCREFGVRYRYNPTVLSALGSHYRWLRALGRPQAPRGAEPVPVV
ncbi:MAG TPA: acyl-CoA desaturase [Gammaproteobacteria bacterium]|jgi:linoleoyl-CoA desaturase|nr:acyl-CoA desaturase [Gammaproteobacteria bacterium]